ncbi:MAG: hypothetical protein HYZ53_17650 [Planctomycetes bacterium]|nr:hypothetical protein [Planctomycetota bacterium]
MSGSAAPNLLRPALHHPAPSYAWVWRIPSAVAAIAASSLYAEALRCHSDKLAGPCAVVALGVVALATLLERDRAPTRRNTLAVLVALGFGLGILYAIVGVAPGLDAPPRRGCGPRSPMESPTFRFFCVPMFGLLVLVGMARSIPEFLWPSMALCQANLLCCYAERTIFKDALGDVLYFTLVAAWAAQLWRASARRRSSPPHSLLRRLHTGRSGTAASSRAKSGPHHCFN